MMLKWLDGREATEVGEALADGLVLETEASHGRSKAQGAGPQTELQKFLQKFLQRVDREARPLELNLFKRAKLANSFKWRLLEKGIAPELVDELTQALVMRLTSARGAGVTGAGGAAAQPQASTAKRKLGAKNAKTLHQQGAEYLDKGAYEQALACYEELLRFDPRDAPAHNGIGTALARLNRFQDAESHLRRAIGIRDSFPEAHFNLAGVLLSTGRYREAEIPLRRALKLKPDFLDARLALAGALLLSNRLAEARDSCMRVLQSAPDNAAAMVGLGKVEAAEGHFAEAEKAFRRAVEVNPEASYAWAALVWQRRMSPADAAWATRANEIAASGLSTVAEAGLRFAIGKYYDDVGDFTRAFRSYQRANELSRLSAVPYDPDARARLVDDLIRVYTRPALEEARGAPGASSSERPLFVVGMPRSGTSLVEQIIASHPSAHGAGELEFWTDAVKKHETSMRQRLPEEGLRQRLTHEYLTQLAAHSKDAARVVDKAPFNSDCLGLIHTAFPLARMIYLQRDPIDTCLSCYFQQFSQVMSFTMDLVDLADYYRQHHRLVAHWRHVLPAETLLVVPYAELVADQETWSRRIIEFVGLPWDERCLEFHKSTRPVNTASVWQVRQKIYRSSVGRWRNYEKFIKPLLSLAELES